MGKIEKLEEEMSKSRSGGISGISDEDLMKQEFSRPEVMYKNYKEYVSAARELGGLAFVGGSAEPGHELSKQATGMLNDEPWGDGDVKLATDMAKRYADLYADGRQEVVSRNLDKYIDQAHEDMCEDMLRKSGLKPGDQVSVRRTSGEVEDDWCLHSTYRGGWATVMKIDDDRSPLFKTIPIDELVALNKRDEK